MSWEAIGFINLLAWLAVIIYGLSIFTFKYVIPYLIGFYKEIMKNNK